MSKQKNKQSEAFYSEQVGWDVDLNSDNCDSETWAFLNRPDNEKEIPLEEWRALYAKRITENACGKAVADDDNLSFDN